MKLQEVTNQKHKNRKHPSKGVSIINQTIQQTPISQKLKKKKIKPKIHIKCWSIVIPVAWALNSRTVSFLESGHLLELGNLRTWPHKKGFSMNPPLLLSLGMLVTVGDCRDRSSIARDYQLGGAESSDHSTDTSSKLKDWRGGKKKNQWQSILLSFGSCGNCSTACGYDRSHN